MSRFSDERGWLVEMYRKDETGYAPAMSYISMTKPGIARGPHEHYEQSDYFFFFGNFRLYLWDNRKESETYKKRMIFDAGGNPFSALVPPRIVHAYKNIGSENGLVVNFPDRLFKGQGKAFPADEIRYENDADSLFTIEP